MTRTELRERRDRLAGAWESFLHGQGAADVRSEVVASWRRSARYGTQRVAQAPVDDPADVTAAWADSPVHASFGAVEADLRRTAQDCDYVAALTDRTGRILWTAGGRTMQRRAERVNFVPGGRWDEASVGTNALDLALRVQAPTTVYSAEHFSPAVHGWVCYAAPITNPVSGEVLGVVDLSSTWDRAHPLALTTVTAMARTLSAELAQVARLAGTLPRPRLGGWPGPGPDPADETGPGTAADEPLDLCLLGRGHLTVAGIRRLLPRRQLEILALLTLHRDGLGLEELHAHLYGDLPVSTTTLKAELSHLRRALGGGIGSRPYRLLRPVRSDADVVLAALRAGDLAAAAAAYGGSLLPWSESPGLTAWRHHVDVAVRTAVLAGQDAEAAAQVSDRQPHDAEVARHAGTLLPPGDPRRALFAARLATIDAY